MTCALAAARASAVARPMPRDAPVTSAVLLARLVMRLSYRWGDSTIADGYEHDEGIAFRQRLCMLQACFQSMDSRNGAASPAVFRGGGRRGWHHQRGRAAAAHGT